MLKRVATVLALVFWSVQVFCPAPAFAAGGCNGSLCFQPQTRTGCLRPQVWGFLRRLSAQVGPLEITAGCNGRHVAHSLHYSGAAVDFRPMRVSQGAAIATLRRDAGVGRVIMEGRGLIHADLGGTGRRAVPQRVLAYAPSESGVAEAAGLQAIGSHFGRSGRHRVVILGRATRLAPLLHWGMSRGRHARGHHYATRGGRHHRRG